ncbi:hypothetical protein [Enterococcus sp. LJL90]
MKKKYGLFLLALIMLIPLIMAYTEKSTEIVAGKTTSQLTEQANPAAQAAQELLLKNLECANQKDVAGYVQTLVPEARTATTAEMTTFFAEYDVENTLQSFEMLKLADNHMLVETKIKSINQDPQQKDYRNHLATANQTFVFVDGQWLIQQAVMIETDFLN